MHKVNILIAEDDKDDFLLLREAIENVLPKFNITHSRDGKEFLQAMDDGPEPDLVFLDLNMPYKSGVECLIEFRKRDGLQQTPVIIYSTSSHLKT